MYITFSNYLVNAYDISIIQYKNVNSNTNEISIKFVSHPDRILYEIYKTPSEVTARFKELCKILQANKHRVCH